MSPLHADLERITASAGFDVSVAWRHSNGQSGTIAEQTPMPAASLIKVPVAMTLAAEVSQGHLDATRIQTIESIEKCGGTGILEDLFDNHAQLTLGQLSHLMLAASDNLATNILFDVLGQDLVSRWCRAANLMSTHVNRLMMDVEKIQQGIDNLTSPVDMTACLMSLFRSASNPSANPYRAVLSSMLGQQHRNGLPNGSFTADPLRIANKTGSFDSYEHDAALFISSDHAIAITVMTAGASTKGDALQVMNRIGNAVASHL